MVDCYLGEIRMYAGRLAAPEGWAFCNGSLLKIADYNPLYSLIGITYGGDGVNTFALPDLRGRVPIHMGQGTSPGQTNHLLGAKLGAETVAVTVNQLTTHTHTLNATTATATTLTPGTSTVLGGIASPNQFYFDMTSAGGGSNEPMAANATSNAGAGASHANIMPSFAINFIISLNGIYPQRQT